MATPPTGASGDLIEEGRPAGLIVINPSGNRTRVPLEPLPFLIGRSADNHLVLRDNRVSRSHAHIVAEHTDFIVEDLKSRHGTFVNGHRIERQPLRAGDRIDFGFEDSYKLVFTFECGEIQRMMDQLAGPAPSPGGPGNLAKLRSLIEVARTLQSSLSITDVLASVVDAALAITGCERGFLLLRKNQELEISVARDKRGRPLATTDLRVPTSVINRSLSQRRELLSMNFDPLEERGIRPEMSVADLELRSVVALPLVHVRTGSSDDTMLMSTVNDTAGLLYMDSRGGAADLSAGNRELLQTLALEASTILENARLLEEEREKQRLEEELKIAREIQTSLLPPSLPREGWFRAAGSSMPSRQVGGDYFDVRQVSAHRWDVVVADVSGKGVSSALLASLLQGAFLLASAEPAGIGEVMSRINRFLNERAKGEKYATLFWCAIEKDGLLTWANAGHCAPLVVKTDGSLLKLEPTGMPLGMLEIAAFAVEQVRLASGDKIVAFTDGLSEAENAEGAFFDPQLRSTVRAHAKAGCAELHDALVSAVEAFTEGATINDDITIVVLELGQTNPDKSGTDPDKSGTDPAGKS